MNISSLQYKDDLKFYDSSAAEPNKVWNTLKNVPEDMKIEFEKCKSDGLAQGQLTHSFSGNVRTSQKSNSRGNVHM